MKTDLPDSIDIVLDRPIFELFAKQAENLPEKTAVTCSQLSFSYGQLRDRSSTIAHAIGESGTPVGSPVALLMDKTCDMVAAILAVLRCGMIYVALDKTDPFSRLTSVLMELNPPLLITDRKNEDTARQLIKEDHRIHVVQDGRLASPFPKPVRPDPQSAACIIYTSGSSGQPKGVVHSHRNILHLVNGQIEDFGITAADRVSLVGSPCHIAGMSDLFRALLCGASLHLFDVREAGISKMVEWLQDEGITILHTVPTVFRFLANHIQVPGEMAALRLIHLGGERLVRNDLRLLRQKFNDDIVMVNNLGCSELSSYRHFFITRDTVVGDDLVPAGYPVADKTVILLDDNQALVKPDEAGEIYIKSDYLALEYWKKPDLTDAAFIPSPFEENVRLYKTGDLARIDSQGCLFYLGRKDKQIKIRGHRVEPAEIENCLMDHPAVNLAVATSDKDEAEPRLVVYAVLAKPCLPVLSGKKRYQLPNGMMIVHQNKAETDHLFENCFGAQNYFKYGIGIKPGDTVVDVGANIGMFTLFVASHCPDLCVYAFEPIDEIFNNLKINCELYARSAKVYNQGISSQAGTHTFQYFPLQSTMSCQDSMFQREIDEKLLEKHIQIDASRVFGAQAAMLDEKKNLVQSRMQGVAKKCTLNTLSHFIRTEDIEAIDLLKVDVQRAEYDVLLGVAQEDWPRIKQIVMELHDEPGSPTEGSRAKVRSFLELRGFAVWIEEERHRELSGRYLLYARQERCQPENGVNSAPSPDTQIAKVFPSLVVTEQQLMDHCHARLPSYMLPSRIVLLEKLPLSPGGKPTLNHLPNPERQDPASYEPHNETERFLQSLWAEHLDISPVSIEDNFFAIGGHSLMAVSLVEKIETFFDIELNPVVFYQAPTIRSLARLIARRKQPANVDTGIAHRFNRLQTASNVFLIHTMRGQILSYAALAKFLGEEFNVHGIPSVGLTEGHIPQKRIQDMARFYIDHIKRVQPKGPYIFGGACLGGYIAHEMGHQLARRGDSIAFIFMIDPTNPLHLDLSDGSPGTASRRFSHRLPISLVSGIYRHLKGVLFKSQSDLPLAALKPDPRWPNPTSTELAVLNANRQARKIYHPPSAAHKTLFFTASRGHGDESKKKHPRYGWELLLNGAIKYYPLDCRHNEILDVSPSQKIAQAIMDEVHQETRRYSRVS